MASQLPRGKLRQIMHGNGYVDAKQYYRKRRHHHGKAAAYRQRFRHIVRCRPAKRHTVDMPANMPPPICFSCPSVGFSVMTKQYPASARDHSSSIPVTGASSGPPELSIGKRPIKG
jgi:hypothetical protein